MCIRDRYGASSSSFRISKSGILAYDHTFDGSTYTIANNNGSAGIPIVIGTKTGGGESLRIDSSGSVGINESTPDSKVDILYSSSTDTATQNLIHLRTDPSGSYATRGLFVKIGRDGNYDNSAAHYDIVGSSGNSGTHIFEVQGSEKLRITKDSQLLKGTTSSRSVGFEHGLQVEGTSASASSLSLTRNSNDINPPYLSFAKSRGTSIGSNTIVQTNDNIGSIVWTAADGNDTDNEVAFIRACLLYTSDAADE